jgi:hypothetical protein
MHVIVTFRNFTLSFFLNNIHAFFLDNSDCNDVIVYGNYGTDYYYNWHIWNDDIWWHNMTFWGGHVQIPSKENIGTECHHDWGNLIALKGLSTV